MINLDAIDIEQGTPEWKALRLGVITASNVSKVLAKKGSDTRTTYMHELIAQVATKEAPEQFGAALTWGRESEAESRSFYALETGFEVSEIGFIYGKDRKVGCSPDGIVYQNKKYLELKNPYTSKVHIDFLLMDKIKPEYLHQCNFGLWITKLDSCDFASYDNRFKKDLMKIRTIERSKEMDDMFENECGEFILEMDKKLAQLNLTYGDQWR